MKEITVKLYQLEELNEDVQKKVIENWRNDDYFDATDEERTLEVFKNITGIRVRYEYDSYNGWINFTSDIDDDIIELSGIRLMKYVVNNFFDDIHKGKYFSTSRIENNKYVVKSRHSRIIFSRDCPLTGVCFDIDILEPMYDVLDGKHVDNVNFTFNDMIEECLENWLKSAIAQYEYWLSEECIREEIEANGYYFTENGKRMNLE